MNVIQAQKRREDVYLTALMEANRDLLRLLKYTSALAVGNQADANVVFNPVTAVVDRYGKPQTRQAAKTPAQVAMHVAERLLLIHSAQTGLPVTEMPLMMLCEAFLPEDAPSFLTDDEQSESVFSGNSTDDEESDTDDDDEL